MTTMAPPLISMHEIATFVYSVYLLLSVHAAILFILIFVSFLTAILKTHHGGGSPLPNSSPHAGSGRLDAPNTPPHLSKEVNGSSSPNSGGEPEAEFIELTPVPSASGGHCYPTLPSIGQFSSKPRDYILIQ